VKADAYGNVKLSDATKVLIEANPVGATVIVLVSAGVVVADVVEIVV
jgi:hypothetical protein